MLLALETDYMPFVIAGIALLLLMIGLSIVLYVGSSRPHS